MKKLDLTSIEARDYDQREKNVLHESPRFKVRIIGLEPAGSIPLCEMASHVIFVCIEGEAEVVVDTETTTLSKGQCLITEPATISMSTKDGVRILGIQIH